MRKKILFLFICCMSFAGILIGCSKNENSEAYSKNSISENKETTAVNEMKRISCAVLPQGS